MKGIIFVLHGRRHKIPQANLQLLAEIADTIPFPSEVGMLEGTSQTLEKAIAALKKKAVTEIIFLPVLLFPATHAKEDLPQRAAACLKGTLPYRILPTLATTEAVRTHLCRQIQRLPLPHEVLLIAHGTPHYEEPFQQLAALAAELTLKTQRKVYPAHYIGGHSYQEFLADHPETLMIQPLFLTEGFITKKIKGWVRDTRGEKDLFLASLENQPALTEAIIERLGEV